MSKVQRVKIGSAVKLFLTSDSVAQQAAGTQRAKARTLAALVGVMEGQFAHDMRTAHVEATITALRAGGARSEASLNTDRYNLRLFVNWLHDNNLLSPYVRPCAQVRRAKIQRIKTDVSKEILTKEQVGDLFGLAEKTHPRAVIEVALGLYAMMRESEIIDLQWEHIHLDDDEPYMRFPRRKQDDYHRVPINDDLAAALADWMGWLEEQGHAIDGKDYVVCRRLAGGRGMNVNPRCKVDPSKPCSNVSQGLRLLYGAVGVENTSGMGVHTLRRTGACDLFAATRDIVMVQRMLGHSDQKTTEIYLRHHSGWAELSQIMRGYDPYSRATRTDEICNVIPLRRAV